MGAWHRVAVAAACAAGLGIAGGIRPAAAQANPTFRIAEIGTLRTDGTGSSSALGINQDGDVVGYADTDDGAFRAFHWTASAGPADLSRGGATLGGPHSKAWAVSDRDGSGNFRVGGEAETALAPISSHAFLFGPSLSDLNGLGPFLGGQNSVTRGVNAAGQAAGAAQVQGGLWHAFKYDPRTGMRDLLTLGGLQSRANGINSRGDVVGAADPPNGLTQAVAWLANGIAAIFFFNGRGATTEATAVNNHGIVCGFGIDGRRVRRAFTGDTNTLKFSGLPFLRGMTRTQAFAINDAGDVVGCSGRAAAASRRAVIWQGGRITDLNRLIPSGSGWVLRCAYGINDRGQIVGEGLVRGNVRGFVLTRR